MRGNKNLKKNMRAEIKSVQKKFHRNSNFESKKSCDSCLCFKKKLNSPMSVPRFSPKPCFYRRSRSQCKVRMEILDNFEDYITCANTINQLESK